MALQQETFEFAHIARLLRFGVIVPEDMEHAVDHEIHTFSATLDLSYNFLAK